MNLIGSSTVVYSVIDNNGTCSVPEKGNLMLEFWFKYYQELLQVLSVECLLKQLDYLSSFSM